MKANTLAVLLAYVAQVGSTLYGPANCVSISRSTAGSCVLSTNCEGKDLSKFEFAFDCENSGQDGIVRHSYGTGGFDSKEEFDTEVKCQRCSPPTTPLPQPVKKPPQAPAHTHSLVATSQAHKGIAAEARAAGVRDKSTAGQQATGLRGSSVVGMASVAQNSQKWFFSPTPTPQAQMVKYGPKQCVATYRAEDGNCIMQTQCKKEDLKDYDFGLICVDKAGLPVRHLFGKDSFDPEETFNTLIQCHQCLGLDDIPGRIALNGQVVQLSDEVKVLKAMMTNLTGNLEKLNAAVFAPGSAWAAPASASAPAPAPAPAPVAANVTNTSLFFHLKRHRRTVAARRTHIRHPVRRPHRPIPKHVHIERRQRLKHGVRPRRVRLPPQQPVHAEDEDEVVEYEPAQPQRVLAGRRSQVKHQARRQVQEQVPQEVQVQNADYEQDYDHSVDEAPVEGQAYADGNSDGGVQVEAQAAQTDDQNAGDDGFEGQGQVEAAQAPQAQIEYVDQAPQTPSEYVDQDTPQEGYASSPEVTAEQSASTQQYTDEDSNAGSVDDEVE